MGPLFLAAAAALAWLVREHLTTPYDALFEAAGKRWDVDPDLLRAFGRKESGFKASAVSPVNANNTRDYGVMQINTKNLPALGLNETTALDPARNIDAAGKLLSSMRAELGDRGHYRELISAYNVGTPTVLRSGIVNEGYVLAVETHHKLYQLGRMFT